MCIYTGISMAGLSPGDGLKLSAEECYNCFLLSLRDMTWTYLNGLKTGVGGTTCLGLHTQKQSTPISQSMPAPNNNKGDCSSFFSTGK